MNTGGKWPVNSGVRCLVPAAGPVSEGAVVGPLVAHSTKGGRHLRQGMAGEWTAQLTPALSSRFSDTQLVHRYLQVGLSTPQGPP